MHVDPHITYYTVYIFDNYTGNIVKKSVAETQYAFNIQDDDLCSMYQVSAWNAGGEGELSAPVQESTPRGKNKLMDLLKLLARLICFYHLYLYHSSSPCYNQ